MEVEETQSESNSPCARVTFLHKTVSEFLHDDDIWSDLLALTKKSSFNVNLALLSSYPQISQALRGRTNFNTMWDEDSQTLFTFARYAVETTHREATLLMLHHKIDEFFSENEVNRTFSAAEEWSFRVGRRVPLRHCAQGQCLVGFMDRLRWFTLLSGIALARLSLMS